MQIALSGMVNGMQLLAAPLSTSKLLFEAKRCQTPFLICRKIQDVVVKHY
jgi:hypothetical protein